MFWLRPGLHLLLLCHIPILHYRLQSWFRQDSVCDVDVIVIFATNVVPWASHLLISCELFNGKSDVRHLIDTWSGWRRIWVHFAILLFCSKGLLLGRNRRLLIWRRRWPNWLATKLLLVPSDSRARRTSWRCHRCLFLLIIVWCTEAWRRCAIVLKDGSVFAVIAAVGAIVVKGIVVFGRSDALFGIAVGQSWFTNW